MVLDPADHDTWSAGSFFTNPVLTPEQAAALPATRPRWPQPDGTVKTSAAWLIEHAGFAKGYGNDAGQPRPTKHTLALTNRGAPPPPTCSPWPARSATASSGASASAWSTSRCWSAASC